LLVEGEGLGPNSVVLSKLFTDGSTPDDYRIIETVLSTTEINLSVIVNIPSAEVLGLAMIARDGGVYVNTISTAISTAGTFVEEDQAQMMTFSPGNSCVIALKGDDADTAMTGLVWSSITV